MNRCKELKIAGATVFRGLEGTARPPRSTGHHLVRRDQPIVVTVVDTAENVARLIPEVEEMMDTGMIAISRRICSGRKAVGWVELEVRGGAQVLMADSTAWA